MTASSDYFLFISVESKKKNRKLGFDNYLIIYLQQNEKLQNL